MFTLKTERVVQYHHVTPPPTPIDRLLLYYISFLHSQSSTQTLTLNYIQTSQTYVKRTNEHINITMQNVVYPMTHMKVVNKGKPANFIISYQILTNYQNSLTGTLRSKFQTQQLLKIALSPTHTADADATQRKCRVASRRRRALGFTRQRRIQDLPREAYGECAEREPKQGSGGNPQRGPDRTPGGNQGGEAPPKLKAFRPFSYKKWLKVKDLNENSHPCLRQTRFAQP